MQIGLYNYPCLQLFSMAAYFLQDYFLFVVVVQSLSPVWLFGTLWTVGFPHYLPEFAQINAGCQWCYLTISSSATPFSFCLQSFPASGSFQMSKLFPSVAKVFELSFSISPSSDSVQFSSVAQLCLTLCDPMDCSTPGFPAHHSQSLLKLMSITLVMPSNHLILSSPSPPALNLCQHQRLFQCVSSLHQVAKVLEFQLQHQSFQWIFSTDFL